jgi:exopolysaccharide biosynthesis polyprenyl glycosylphosphotransferase
MGELTSNRLWDLGSSDYPSQYARMIPGTNSIPAPRLKLASSPAAQSVDMVDNSRGPISPARGLPHLAATSLGGLFCWPMAADLAVLLLACAALSQFFAANALPLATVPVFSLLVALLCFGTGLYKQTQDTCNAASIAAQAQAIALAAGLVIVTASGGIRVRAAFGTPALSLAVLIMSRQFRWVMGKRQCRDSERRKILIVGGGPVGRSIARALRNEPVQRTIVCGFVDDELPLSPAVLGRIDDLEWLARSEFIDEIILALPDRPIETRKVAAVAFRNHLDIRAVPDLPPGPWPDSGIDHIGEVPVITLHREPLPNTALVLKRWLDVACSVIGLMLSSPLMTIVGLLIRLDSPGPVIYSAERAGAKGRRFRCYKFRSMVSNAAHLKEDLRIRNQRQGPIFKLEDDPRITRVGRFIRRYSLDELPQLWNVLRGDMSLVGPRPHPVEEVDHYDLQHLRRLDVKPGITGLWQITARGCPSFELNMHLDLTYIENWTLLLDLRILAGTIRVLFAPEGA